MEDSSYLKIMGFDPVEGYISGIKYPSLAFSLIGIFPKNKHEDIHVHSELFQIPNHRY